jgi:hypothetical protein
MMIKMMMMIMMRMMMMMIVVVMIVMMVMMMNNIKIKMMICDTCIFELLKMCASFITYDD